MQVVHIFRFDINEVTNCLVSLKEHLIDLIRDANVIVKKQQTCFERSLLIKILSQTSDRNVHLWLTNSNVHTLIFITFAFNYMLG